MSKDELMTIARNKERSVFELTKFRKTDKKDRLYAKGFC